MDAKFQSVSDLRLSVFICGCPSVSDGRAFAVRSLLLRTFVVNFSALKITIETTVKADSKTVWAAWNNPEDIKRWNAASDDWHTTRSSVDLREGGQFSSRMEAKDGSFGFDFAGTFTRVVPEKLIEYRMSDAREVKVEFDQLPGGIRVRETFDAETQHDPEFQRKGWQAILDNFARHVEAKGTAR